MNVGTCPAFEPSAPLALKRDVFYVSGIFVQLCIGGGVPDKFPICINTSIVAPVVYENISVPMRNTSRKALEDADRSHKLIAVVNGPCARGMVPFIALVFSTASLADVNYNRCDSRRELD